MIEKETVLNLHAVVEEAGECFPGVLKEGLLESAIAHQNYYETPLEQALHVSASINCEHIFNDGNKRTSYLVLWTMEEDYPKADFDKVSRLILSLAKSDITKDEFMEQTRQCFCEEINDG